MTGQHHCCQRVASALLVLGCVARTLAAPPLVVETDPQPAEVQRQQFALPPGFRIELIACEPDIGQPMNLNFDAAGRLWVTHSVEYPYPVEGPGVEPRDERFGPNGQPPAKDRLSIISGIGTDNLQISHVAEGLNIPIGIVPLSTTSAILYSIPNIAHLAIPQDSQPSTLNPHPLFGPFGNVDTHGMVNGLTHWIDGWVYACHGFRNTSTIAGSDGHEVTMNSGNTFRFKPDGSHVEQWTWGQVNPFGMTFDPWGNLYTADCHSMPLTCVIPGAYYSSFGKPHDGLGFGPNMIDHSHGSTGICGPCYYAADQFPPDYRDNLFLCNPVTGIVHRDKLVWNGSSPQVATQPDFITCRDGWFRPVDIQLGPDGALYIADFYNSIIGHYEVPLEDPRRDRTHGRIWRVTWQGDESPDSNTAPATMPDLTRESLDQQIARLADRNLTVRVLASHVIVERASEDTPVELRAAIDKGGPPVQHAHLLWLLQRLGSLTRSDLGPLLTHDSPLLRTHAARLLGNMPQWQPDDALLAIELLHDDDPRVRRAAAESWSLHPHEVPTEMLIRNLPAERDADTHLRHAMRIALRNGLLSEGALRSRIDSSTTSDEVATVCLGIDNAESAAYLLNHLRLRPDDASRGEWITHIARHGSQEDIGALATVLREQAGDRLADHVAALEAFEAGQSLGAAPRHPEFLAWAADVAAGLLEQVRTQAEAWHNLPLPGSSVAPVTWGLETRTATDGQPTQLWSSLPGGERGVGIARSPSFAMPERLTFCLAGHDGFPQQEAAGQNFVRLVRDQDGTVLQTRAAPRQDPPVEVTWEATGDAGANVHIELIDGVDIDAYAWIAAGRFSVPELNPHTTQPSQLAARLIGSLKLRRLEPELRTMIADPQLASGAVSDLAVALLAVAPDVRLEALAPWLRVAPDSTIGRQIRQQLLTRDETATQELLEVAMRSASQDRQRAMAEVLAGHREGARTLLSLVEAGRASPRLLRTASIMQKLAPIADPSMQDRVAALLRDLPPENEELAELIRQRRAGFNPSSASTEHGHAVFKKTCAACHQIGSEGNKIGPQLDGVGIRGLDRLLEDTLDPNRNVDAAFRTATILTTDGRVLSGLVRREEGESLVLADSKGKEFRVRTDDIEERAISPLSLMPADIAEKLPEEEFHDLMAFLLSQRADTAVQTTEPPDGE